MTTTILVSGLAGFLGSAYARHVLETTDWQIVGLDRIDEAASLSRIPSPHWGRILQLRANTRFRLPPIPNCAPSRQCRRKSSAVQTAISR